MQPITLPNPTPGKHTLRVPLDPQPHPGIVGFIVLRSGEFKPIWSEPYRETMANNDCLFVPYKPGETYNDGKCLSVNLVEHGDGWAWVIEFEVTNNTRSDQ